jgi:hypothetical protein
MFELTLKLKNKSGILSRLDQLSDLKFTEETWWGTQQRLHKLMRDRATKIKRYSVSKKTHEWRKSRVANSGRVSTHVGEMAPVLSGPRVGMRTGTFLRDLANSVSPGVFEVIGVTDQGINNGIYFYGIDEKAFDRKYPTMFEQYLIKRGIIEDGLTVVDESQGQSLLDTLSSSVANHLNALWYSNVN